MLENTIAQRIKILSETLEEKSAAFLKATGLTYQNLHDLTSGRKGGPSYPTTMKILSAYPQISERWFLFGEGDMLKTSAQKADPENILSYGAGIKAQQPGQTGLQDGLLTHDPTEEVDEPMPTYSPAPKKKKPLGTDLIEEVSKHSAQIKELFELLKARPSVDPNAQHGNAPDATGTTGHKQ